MRTKLKAIAVGLREHRATQLAKKARGKEAEEQRQKEAYLEFEVSSQPRHLLLPSGPLCHAELRHVVKGMAQSGTIWVTLGGAAFLAMTSVSSQVTQGGQ